MSRLRYLSQVFQPVITIPKNAKIKNTDVTCKSQKLLLECGLIRPTSSGLFTILPLARRALNKLEHLVRTCIEDVGGQQISLPALTSVSLWEQSGRLDDAPAELLKLDDRHGKEYLLAPTHEESIADLLADVGPQSYKQLPLLLYQISNKYRDEHRPKHGMLRAREFSMMDLYGVHGSVECAEDEYATLCGAYRRLFEILQLPVYRVEAPAGDMGGSVSHEWQVAAGAGEDSLAVCAACARARRAGTGRCSCGGDLETRSSIEVGHTFILGTKYSEALNANFVNQAGKTQPLIMSCYGIGITRLLAASLEALSTEKALRWPEAIAPYNTVVIGPKEGSKEWLSDGWDRTQAVARAASRHKDVVIDDRHGLTIGKRLMMADRHKTKIGKYAELVETLVGTINKTNEDFSAKFDSALVARDTATVIATQCAPSTELKQPEIQSESSTLAPVHQRTLYAHVAAPKHKHKRNARARQEMTLASTSAQPSSSAAGSTIFDARAPAGGKRPTAPRPSYAPAQPSNTYDTHELTTLTASTSHHDDDQGWERVQNHRTRRDNLRRRTVIRGSGVNDDELKTVERARKIHACFFTPETTAETIISYMRRKKQCDNYHVDKLKLAHSYYSSFSLTVPNSHFEFFMSAENWPTSTQVSEWFRGSGGRADGAPRAHPAPRRQQRYACDSATCAYTAAAARGTSKQGTYVGATRASTFTSGKSTSTL